MIAGKWTAAAVCPVHAGRETDDHEAWGRISKRGDGPGVIIRMSLAYLCEVPGETWTRAALEGKRGGRRLRPGFVSHRGFCPRGQIVTGASLGSRSVSSGCSVT